MASLQDPRGRLPGPALPDIIRWKVEEGGTTSLSGDCFADDSCTLPSKLCPQHNRVGWAIVEAYRLAGRIGLRLGKSVAGTLPGPEQSSEGTGVYALLTWLRHVDQLSALTPRFYIDCHRVVDGWRR